MSSISACSLSVFCWTKALIGSGCRNWNSLRQGHHTGIRLAANSISLIGESFICGTRNDARYRGSREPRSSISLVEQSRFRVVARVCTESRCAIVRADDPMNAKGSDGRIHVYPGGS